MEKLQLDNAKARKRILAFLLDSFFVNIFRIFLQIIIIPSSLILAYNETLVKFTENFPNTTFSNLNSAHISYFIQSPIYVVFLRTLFLFTFSGIVYNILCYCFLKKRTLAQKILSLKVVNLSNNKEISKLRLIIKAVVTPLPIIIMLHLTLYQFLFFFNFHLIAPKEFLSARIISFFVRYSNPYIILFMGTFFLLFWYNIYFLTNRLILSDIISHTRVINTKALINLEELKKVESKGNFIVSFGDALISKIEKINKFLSDLVVKYTKYISNIFKKK